MKILAPISDLTELSPLIKNGADEFYMGIFSQNWFDQNQFFNPLNRRYTAKSNVLDMLEAQKIITQARTHEKPVYITFNTNTNFSDQKVIINELENIIKLKPEAIIARDPIIIKLIRKLDKSLPIYLSSLDQVVNTQAVKFWHENFNISKFVLPRNLNLAEIRKIAQDSPQFEFELFIYNDDCFNNVDGLCSSIHYQKHDNQDINFVCHRENLYKSENLQEEFINLNHNRSLCNACLFFHLKDIPNIKSAKIVGRDKTIEEKIKLVQFLKQAKSLVAKENDFNKFQKKTKMLHKLIFKNTYCQNCPYAPKT
jgi:collagenase-like PrtC family protease